MEQGAVAGQALAHIAQAHPARDESGSDGEEMQLVKAALQDRAAFAVLYRRHVTPVYRYFYQQAGNPQDAEDLTATTFRKALASLGRYRGNGSFAAWLFRIARYTFLDYKRVERLEVDVASVAEMLSDPSPQPDAQIVWAEQAGRLHYLVRQLPDDQREAVMLRFFAELRTREVARILGRSEGAVKMLIYRAVAALRAEYVKEQQP